AGPIEGAAQAGISSDGRLESLEEIERRHIELALSSCGGVISGPRGAASALKIPRSTLLHRMQKLGIRQSRAS
ncbi:MAG: hypothetical protein LBH65_05270, partial [Desulfovibrio sp.]|nr:hypothetical protein [Desulfovibrio sp.]